MTESSLTDAKYRNLFETANDAILIADAITGIILDANKLAETLLGIPREDIIGMHQTGIHPANEHKKYKNLFQEFIGRGGGISDDIYVVNKSGQKIPVQISCSVTTTDGKTIIEGIFRDLTNRKKVEETIINENDMLEHRVIERTTELNKVITLLQEEMKQHIAAKNALQDTEKKLKNRAQALTESNVALKVLLSQRERDQIVFEKNIMSNIKHLIEPYITKLKRNRSMSEELNYLNILEDNLKEIVAPFSSKLSSAYFQFTPKEILIADLIKDGKQDKDITDVLNISIYTVKSHRKNIRKKLGIYGKRNNLRTTLMTLT